MDEIKGLDGITAIDDGRDTVDQMGAVSGRFYSAQGDSAGLT